jgi:2-C-methyl-D-erythritol 4-phosphate cytidylyltransferase/2-C-methyl-D-erythritol 2,4-cyclodiphosphate synthase
MILMSEEYLSTAVVIAAAGNSTRMGAGIDKQFVMLDGYPVLWHTLNLFKTLPPVKQVLVTVSTANSQRVIKLITDSGLETPWQVVVGGTERQHSVSNALNRVDKGLDLIMVHDGARPFVDRWSVLKSMELAAQYGAAVVAVPVKDTIKVADSEGRVRQTLDRSTLWQVQTPQTFRREVLLSAYDKAASEGFLATDDAALVEWAGGAVHLVRGSYYNFKVTTPEDLLLAEAVAAGRSVRRMQRVGFGYDVHQFVAGRPLMLGGVSVPYEKGLEGHSDADVLLHAISDALLGAAGLGDIGRHFPDNDPKYKGISSLALLQEVKFKVVTAGFTTHNVDAVVAAQEPRLAPYINEMNQVIAGALSIDPSQVNIKATTTERLGFVGRKEGIAAQAVVLIG